MCGRFTLRTPMQKLVAEFQFYQQQIEFWPRYNIAPTQDVGIVRLEAAGRRLSTARWGLLPPWQKPNGPPLINIRAETLAETATFRDAFHKRRCLILTDGFYEWQRIGVRKQPYYFQLAGGRPFAFAGVWEPRQGKVTIDSCALVTSDANSIVSAVHNRMPVILPTDAAGRWLDTAEASVTDLLALLRPYEPADMEAWPVSALVNKPQNDTPKCIEPSKPETSGGLLFD